MERKSLLWFLILAFSLAWILFLLPLAFGAPGSLQRQTMITICWAAAMWAPGVAALIVTRLVLKMPIRQLGLGRLGEKRVYLWAWLTPIVLSLITGLLSWLFQPDKLDLSFAVIRETMASAPGGTAVPPALVVAAQIAGAITLAPLINTLFALGEELGWRGFLLPLLLPQGQPRAILISGLIWGIWHAPAILQGHNYPSQPVLGVLMMIVFTVLFGAFLSWLYLRTGSPWAPALGHGTVNAVAGLPIIFMPGVNITYTATLASPVGWISLGLLVILLIWRRRLPVNNPQGWGAQQPENPTTQT